jgi:hypothetical protein
VIERIREAQPQTHLTGSALGCLTAMTNGDVTAISGDHWSNALQTGGITAVVATVLAGIGLRVSNWTRALVCGLTTFGVEVLSQSPTYGTTQADIYRTCLVAGLVASALAYGAGILFERLLNRSK